MSMLTNIFFIYILISCFKTDASILDETEKENEIYVLKSNNFDEFIKSNDVVMVEFYAPWCGHCKALEPVYREASQQLKSKGYQIPLSKVDATVEKELAKRFDISGYPTLKFFKNDNYYDYDGERTTSAIVDFMIKVSSPDWSPPPNYVLTLTKENFTEIVDANDFILVEFYAPWCGHCKRLAPEYEKAAGILMKQDPPILLAAVDATKETELAIRYNITGYPTLKLFRNSNPTDYNGPRYNEGIVEWMLKNRQNAARLVESLSELKRMRDPGKVLLLGIFDNDKDTLFSKFIDAANSVREDFISAYSFSKEIFKHFRSIPEIQKVGGEGGDILLLRPEYLSNQYEPSVVKFEYDGNYNNTIEKLVDFFKREMFPIVAEYTSHTKNFLDVLKKDYLCLFFFTVDFSMQYRTGTRKWLEKIVKIAFDYRNQIQFAIADDERQSDKLRDFRLEDSGEEINVGCVKINNDKYRMPIMENFDSEHIRSFLDNMVSDRLFPLLKSSPLPKNPLSGGITTVVGDSYKSLINDVLNEGFILLYRSPCIKCSETRNVLSKLSLKMKNKALTFFSMDISQNDLPAMDGLETIDYEPSLYLIVNKPNVDSQTLLRKQMIKYIGDNLKETDIQSFLSTYSKSIKEEL